MKNLLLGIALFIAVAYGGSYGYHELVKYQSHITMTPLAPPFLHLDDEKPTTELHAGQVFWLRINTRRTTTCLAEISYRIIQETTVPNETPQTDDDVIRRRILQFIPGTKAVIPAGQYLMDVRFELPTWIEPGDYLLDRAAVYTCEGMSFDRAPKIPFHVVR